MEKYKIYLAGEFISTKNEIEVNNPYTNQAFAKTYLASKNLLEQAIQKAQASEKEMKNLPAYIKAEILNEIADNLRVEKEHLAKIIAQEAGKPLKYALGEVDRAEQTFRIAAEETKRLPAEYLSIDWTAAGEGKEAIVKHFPIGTIAAISPFNFPLNLTAHKIAPAIAAGNPIILKPARSTPISVLELARIISKTKLPKGAFSVLPTDRETGNLLVTDERFKMLTFTGSPSVGWKMKEQAGKKKIALELGGNAGVIISDTAEIETAVNRCLMGGFAYSGQVCIHVQRIFVHKKIAPVFIEKLTKKIQNLKEGNPLDLETDISVLIDEENAIRVESWVNEAEENGAKILCGGKRKGRYFQPTLITNVKKDMKVCQLEVFGPVVTVEIFDDFNEAIENINNSQYGLQAGVFTNKIDEMNLAFKELEVGGIIINDVPTFRVDHMPYGGVKNSGFGREGVKYAIHEMMEPRLLVKPL